MAYSVGLWVRVGVGRTTMSYGAMQVISFKNTGLFKRGMWLSAAALIAFVVFPAALDGTLLENPIPHMVAVGALITCWVIFFWKTQIHRVADEVVDCGDHLRVRRGRVEEDILFSKISAVEMSTHVGIHRITVRLRELSRFGAKIEFLPQASLWSNPGGVRRVASGLAERASQATGARSSGGNSMSRLCRRASLRRRLWCRHVCSIGDAKAGLKSVAVEQRVTGQSLRVRFAAQTAPVDWEIAFTTRAAASRAL